MDTAARPLLLKALAREPVERPPIWFMRQAGRCLPEYHELRAQAGDFMTLAMTPQMAAEVTLQPMRRFAYDAAITFADILLLPHALGQDLWFETGEGPRLGSLPPLAEMEARIATAADALSSVGETIRRVRAELEPHRALIGFAGAPWTVATYMLQGRGGEEARAAARKRAVETPGEVDALIDVLTEATVGYLAMQVAAGAQAVQIFESWAEHLTDEAFDRLVIRPHARIVQGLRSLGVTTPVIGFPRAAEPAQIERYGALTGVQAVGLSTTTPAAVGRRLQARVAIQGALDPELLLRGGAELSEAVDRLLADWGDGPYVFNLGHGVIPQTPVEHIAQVVEQVTTWRAA